MQLQLTLIFEVARERKKYIKPCYRYFTYFTFIQNNSAAAPNGIY